MGHSAGSVFRIMGASWDGTAPAALLWQVKDSTHARLVWAGWRSGAWETHTIVESIAQIVSNATLPGAAMLAGDPYTVFVSEKATKFEMQRYTSPAGTTWTPLALTSSSTYDNFRPIPVNDAGTYSVLWVQGTTNSSDTAVSVALLGYAP